MQGIKCRWVAEQDFLRNSSGRLPSWLNRAWLSLHGLKDLFHLSKFDDVFLNFANNSVTSGRRDVVQPIWMGAYGRLWAKLVRGSSIFVEVSSQRFSFPYTVQFKAWNLQGRAPNFIMQHNVKKFGSYKLNKITKVVIGATLGPNQSERSKFCLDQSESRIQPMWLIDVTNAHIWAWQTTWPHEIKNTRTQELNPHFSHSFNDRVEPGYKRDVCDILVTSRPLQI